MAEVGTGGHIGERLRRDREGVGLSVRTLAARSGFSPSFISQVENGLASPSIGSLEKIAACLDVSLGELFAGPHLPASSIVRAGARPRLRSGWSHAEIASLRSGSASRLDPLLITLQPGGRSGKSAHALPREQFVFVVSGRVLFTLAGVEQRLTRGDAVTVRAAAPALWVNTSARPVRLLFVAQGLV